MAVGRNFYRPNMKLFLTLTLIFTSYSLFSQTNVDSIIASSHVKEVQILSQQKDTANLIRYSKEGKMTYNFLNNFGGSTFLLKTSTTWIYNDSGRVIKTISTHSSFPDSTAWVYEYDTKGNRVSTKTVEGRLIFKYYYDDSNFLVKQLSFDDSSKLEETTTYEKVNNGKKVISTIMGNFIKNRTNTTYFDDNGNNIKTESYDGVKINFSTESVFKGNRLVKITYNSGYGSNYTYDSKGRLIKRSNFKIENDKEKNSGFEVFTYNDKGLLINYEENIYYSGNLRKYRYEYDFYD